MQLKSFAHFCKLKKISSTRFSRSEVVQYLEYIQNVKKWSPESRAVAIVLMRAYLKWAFENRFIKKQPDSLLSNKDRPKLCQPLPKPLAREIDSEILRRVSGSSDIYHKQIYVIRQTGMRVGEACSLSQDCLFEVNSKTKYSLKVPVGKNRKERLVPINADCIQVIQAIQKKNRKRNCKYLFQNEMGKRIKEPELRSVFNSLVSDIPSENPITIHRLRHTYATEMVDASLNLQSLAVILGHSNIASTLRYSAVTDQSIGNDYHKSIEIIKDLYGDVHLVESSNSQERKNGRDMLTLAWKCLKKEFADKQITHQPNVRNFLERLSRLSENLGDLQNTDIK
jgi:integrase/recombinase XerC